MLLRLIRTHLAPYRGWLWLLMVLQLISVAANLVLPTLNAALIDDGLVRADVDEIWRMGSLMLVVSFAQVVAASAVALAGARIAMGFGRDIRAAIFEHVGGFSTREHQRYGAPSLITRCTNDVQQVQMLVLMTCTLMVSAPIMMAGGVVMALREDLSMSWLMVVAVPVLTVAIGAVVLRIVPKSRLLQTRLDKVNQVLREQLTGLRVVRAFVREPAETARFAEANEELTGIARSVSRLMGSLSPIVLLVLNASTVAVVWFGGHRIAAGELQVGSLTAYMTYLLQILLAVMMSTLMLMLVPRASVAAERITEVFETESSVAPPRRPASVRRLSGVVDLVGVGMRYPAAAEPVLTGVDLHVEPGQTAAVIGSTGAGKTTLLSLVARLFDPTQGQVLIDGVDIADLDPAVLWSSIGLVPQKPYLFTGTIASNLRFGRPDATCDELWEALETAQARHFVSAMPLLLDSPVHQGGVNLSGGQRQRLCIARAVVARPSVYLLDDSFSALDAGTEASLRAALGSVTQDAAVIVVAQRTTSIEDADRIVVLDQGRVVGTGCHSTLLAECATYQEIVRSQQGALVAP